MAVTNIAVVFIGTIIYFSSFSTAVKTHTIWMNKVDPPEMDPDFIDGYEVNLKKISKHNKLFNANFNLKQDIDSEIMCEVKIFQKSNGNYVRTPVEIAKSPCCEFLEQNKLIWPCLRERSSFPENCPVPKGAHWFKEFNADNCNYTENLPPRLPEEYKSELHVSRGAKRLFQQTYYGTLKKIMFI